MIDPGGRSRLPWRLTPIGRGGISRGGLRGAIRHLATSSVHGAESPEGASLVDSVSEQRANVSPGAESQRKVRLPVPAIKSRGRNDRSVPVGRPEPTRASAGMMSRIATNAGWQLSERRQLEW
jgi:hypothetical protein